MDMRIAKSDIPKLVVPALFLGCALFTNVTFVPNLAQVLRSQPLQVGDALNGHLAAEIDAAFKRQLPYSAVSVAAVGAARYMAFSEGRKGVVVGRQGWLFSSEEFRSSRKPSEDIERSVTEIANIREALAQRSITLVMAPLPAKADVYSEFAGNPALSEEMAQRYSNFKQGLVAAHVETADIKAALLAAKPTDAVFLRTDTHWSPEGAAAAARTLADIVGPVGAHQSFSMEQEDPHTIEGDLVRFVVGAGFNGLVGLAPESITLRRATLAGKAEGTIDDLFGTATTVPVALVGTSYSANASWGFADSLKADLGADVVNFAEEGRGPVTPMRAFLANLSVREAPPQVVIWEFPIRYLTDPTLWDSAPAKEE
jgi:alginate O-acetyltransferase complex protein AlgJ